MKEPSERIQKRVRIWCRKNGADTGLLDRLVEDVKNQQANKINNQGLRAQVKYMLQHYTSRELMSVIEHEIKILRRYRRDKRKGATGHGENQKKKEGKAR